MLYFCKHKQIMFNDYNYDYNLKKNVDLIFKNVAKIQPEH